MAARREPDASAAGEQDPEAIRQRNAQRLDHEARRDALAERDNLLASAWPHTCTRCGREFHSLETLTDPDAHGPIKGHGGSR